MDNETKSIVDSYTESIVNHADGYGVVARDFVRKMLIGFGERLIGEIPDLEEYKDTKKQLLEILREA